MTSVNVDLLVFLLKMKLYLNSNKVLCQEIVKLQNNMGMKHVFEESILGIVNIEIIFTVSTLYIFHEYFCLS